MIRLAGATAMAAALLLVPAREARAGRVPSNSELLSRAIAQALDSLGSSIPVTAGTLVVASSPGQRKDWALENMVASRLKGHAGRILFRAGSGTAEPGSAEASAVEGSNGNASGDSMSAMRSIPPPSAPAALPAAGSPGGEESVLEYRIGVMSVSYDALHKAHFFGPGTVDRTATVTFGLRLLAPDGQMVWSGDGAGTVSDQVPQRRLHDVEDQLYTFARPQLPTGSLTRLVEPAIVVGLVTGLVFLFYTNRN